MKKDELYKEFSHYEALSKDSSTHAQRVEIYRLMEKSGINVPEDTDSRLTKGRFPFNCDFFISKHPTAKIIKWVPTRSPEKKSKFVYKDPKYFLDILAGVTFTGVVVDPLNNTLEEQAKHVGAVLLKIQTARITKEQVRDTIVDVLANEIPIVAYDDETISIGSTKSISYDHDDSLPF